MHRPTSFIHGRGSAGNPKNRFEAIERVIQIDDPEVEQRNPATCFIADTAKEIISRNKSPDIGFEAGLNPYRGCEHGCTYCYARPTHEYLGFSCGLDFETKILVKEQAPELLRKALANPRWKPTPLSLSGVTDPYQPIERQRQLTRRCLAVLAEFRNPVVIITKNYLVTRDRDILSDLARYNAVLVFISITTLDPDLCGIMEPRTTRPHRRLEAIQLLSEAGIPTGVNIAPVIPGLTDHEIPAIIKAATSAGASFAGMTLLRLPYQVKSLFVEWLQTHFPDRKEKILNKIRSIRGGRLNDPNFGSRMDGDGPYAKQITKLFEISCKQARISECPPALSTAHFKSPAKKSHYLLPLFEKVGI